MKIQLYQVDAFADAVFSGNPAAVCPLKEWLPKQIMQKIAQENNLSETAFIVPKNEDFEIRWFTPEIEVALCGHATLAAAHILFEHLAYPKNTIKFNSVKSGVLPVTRDHDGAILLDFPADHSNVVEDANDIQKAIGLAPKEIRKGKTDYLLIYNWQKEIETIEPNHFLLAKTNCRGVIVSAPGNDVDFVSRFFAPGAGIDEDPVTGSAHTTMIPYWAKALGKQNLSARQLSKRGGFLSCEYLGERVKIGGKAVTYLEGTITI